MQKKFLDARDTVIALEHAARTELAKLHALTFWPLHRFLLGYQKLSFVFGLAFCKTFDKHGRSSVAAAPSRADKR